MNLYPEWIHLFLCTMYHDPSDLGSLILIGIIIKKIVCTKTVKLWIVVY